MLVRIATWNLQGGDPREVGLPELVEAHDPDVVLLQEARSDLLALTPALEGHTHRVLRPDAGYPPGLSILSQLPIDASGHLHPPGPRPRLVWARLVPPDGRPLVVASLHAAAPIGPPWSDNPWRRAVHLRAFRAFAADLADQGIPAVLAGDTNTIRYRISGHTDAALSVGRAPRTWRPVGGIPWLPAVARLDRILVGPSLRIVDVVTRCDISSSDHCPVIATVDVPPDVT